MRSCENTLIRASACQYHWSGEAGYSFKRFSSGAAHYRIDGLRRRVDSSHFLLLNEGQTYELDIDSSTPVVSRCLFFSSELIHDVFRDLTASAVSKLDNPGGHHFVELVQRLYVLDSELLLSLKSLECRELSNVDSNPLGREECFRRVAERLVERSLDRKIAEANIEALKASTRQEIFRRVGDARDYIISHWEKTLKLSEIAAVASLSPNHLLRSFRAAYGTTPGRFQ